MHRCWVLENTRLIMLRTRAPSPTRYDDHEPRMRRAYVQIETEENIDNVGIGYRCYPRPRGWCHSSYQEGRQAPPARICHPDHHLRPQQVYPQVRLLSLTALLARLRRYRTPKNHPLTNLGHTPPSSTPPPSATTAPTSARTPSPRPLPSARARSPSRSPSLLRPGVPRLRPLLRRHRS
jgi:hypothetical protein